ncbi:hypothetical protein [Penaeicola halotolerans]|uniref:hypothetical protein n=1 Tax=Penaeicola halotolerans TaxID=2793196 RepID=UPI001CF901CB|nr:hypothetical protein [Penaeicola halotolerans]
MYIPYEQLSDQATVWTYLADRPVSEHQEEITNILRAFCEKWNSHGAPLQTSFTILHDQLIVLAADEAHLPSGCSIDSSVAQIRELENKFGLSLLDRSQAGVYIAGQVHRYPLLSFKHLIQVQDVQPDTLLLNPMVKTKAELAEKGLIKAKESWLSRHFETKHVI